MAIPTQLKPRSLESTAYKGALDTAENSFTILSTTLLLRGEYSRSGDDLIIRGEMGEEVRVEGYFAGELPPTLQSPEGAVLLPEIVQKLLVNTDSFDVAGPAGTIRIPGLLGDPIGTVDDIGADANVTAKGADGITRALKPGDPIYKDDVVETVGRSFANLRMVDDTSFQLGKETRAIIENYSFTPGTESGQFEATILDGFFRYASGQLGGLDKGTHTTIKTPTAQLGVRGSELEGMIEQDGATTFLHHDGILDVADAYGRGSVTLTEPGTATAVSSRPGAPADVFEAPDSLTKAFEEALPPPLPDFVVEGREEEGEEALDLELEINLDELSEEEKDEFELKLAQAAEELVELEGGATTTTANEIPVATDDHFQGSEDQLITGSLVSNDQLGDGKLSWSVESAPQHGEVVIDAEGNFEYRAIENYEGTDRFSYTILDRDGESSTAVVTLTVGGVADAPVVTQGGATARYVENIPAVLLFSDAQIDTIESGEQLTALVLTVEGVVDGAAEQLWIGSEYILLDGSRSSGEIAGQDYTVTVDGTVATVSLSGRWEVNEIINAIGYRNSSLNPTESSRTVSLLSLTDSGELTNGGQNNRIFDPQISSTVNVSGINSLPTVTHGGTTLDYFESGVATLLFSDAQVDTIETGQQLTNVVLTVSGLVDGAAEELWIGSEFIVLDGSQPLGQIGGQSYTVDMENETATITLSGIWETGEIINLVGYKNSSLDPTEGSREISLVSLSDSGGSENGGQDTHLFETQITSTIQLTGINNPPNVTQGVATVVFAKAAPAVLLFSDAEIDTIEQGQELTGLVVTVGGLVDGANELLWIGDESIALDGSTTSGQVSGVDYRLELIGDRATVTLSGSWSAGTVVQTLGYSNTSLSPTESDRTVSLISLTDSGGVENSGQDSQLFDPEITSLIHVTTNNTPPSVTQGVTAVEYVEAEPATLLFSNAQVDTIEDGQQLIELVLTVSGIADGASEQLWVGSDFIVLDGSTPSGTVAGQSYTVEEHDGTAIVTLSNLAGWNEGEIIHALGYKNTSSAPTETDRTVSIVSLTDSGGIEDGGENFQIFNPKVTTTVSVVNVNAAPVLTLNGGSGVTYTEPVTGSPSVPIFLFRATQNDPATGIVVDTVETNQIVTVLTVDISNTALGDRLIIGTGGTALDISPAMSSTASYGGDATIPPYTVAVSDAEVTFTGQWTAAEAGQLLSAIQFNNTGNDPTWDGTQQQPTREIVLSVTDQPDTLDDPKVTTLSRSLTISPLNQNPEWEATASVDRMVTYSEVGDITQPLFSFTDATTVESGQTFSELQLTVNGVLNGATELLTIAGEAFSLSTLTETAATNATVPFNYAVSGTSADKLVTLTGAWDPTQLQQLIDSIQFSVSEITTSSGRTITLGTLKDSGGIDAAETLAPLSLPREVMVVANDGGITINETETENQLFQYDEANGDLMGGATKFHLDMKISSLKNDGTLFSYGTTAGGIQVKIDSSSVVTFTIGGTVSETTGILSTALFDGVSHTLSFEWDNGKITTWLDGVKGIEKEAGEFATPYLGSMDAGGTIKIGDTDFSGVVYDVNLATSYTDDSNDLVERSAHWAMENVAGNQVVNSDDPNNFALDVVASATVDQHLYYVKDDMSLGDLFFDGLEPSASADVDGDLTV
ncbi:MAG: cadherin-like domain-containing protein, partial [Gammaproteobacteria bacterium]|nr:cadherin-like domain-containing protein [Gammaproteobacteria bacterium]